MRHAYLFLFNSLHYGMLPVKKNTLVGDGISCPVDDVRNKF